MGTRPSSFVSFGSCQKKDRCGHSYSLLSPMVRILEGLRASSFLTKKKAIFGKTRLFDGLSCTTLTNEETPFGVAKELRLVRCRLFRHLDILATSMTPTWQLSFQNGPSTLRPCGLFVPRRNSMTA